MLITTSNQCPYSEYIPIETVCEWLQPKYNPWSNQIDKFTPEQMLQYIFSNLTKDAENDGGSAIIGFRLFVYNIPGPNFQSTESIVGYGTSIKKP